MSDLIDRAEAQTALQFAAKRYTLSSESGCDGHVLWSYPLISVTDAMNALRKLPSAQSEPKTGKWIHIWDAPDGRYKGKCENCGFTHIFRDGHDSQYNFCPECGKNMRGDSDDKQ